MHATELRQTLPLPSGHSTHLLGVENGVELAVAHLGAGEELAVAVDGPDLNQHPAPREEVPERWGLGKALVVANGCPTKKNGYGDIEKTTWCSVQHCVLVLRDTPQKTQHKMLPHTITWHIMASRVACGFSRDRIETSNG